jgi:hypothetical protein
VRLFQTGIPPRLSGVGRLEDTYATRPVTAYVALARSKVNDVWVRRGNRYRTDAVRGQRNLTVRDVFPTLTVVGASPDASLDAAHVEQIWIRRHSGYGNDATTDERTDATPVQLTH